MLSLRHEKARTVFSGSLLIKLYIIIYRIAILKLGSHNRGYFHYCIFRLKNYHYNMFLGRRHPTEQHEILDGIVAKPGGGHITRRCDHRRVLQQSRQVFHGQKMYFLDLISQNPGCIDLPHS